MFPISRDPPEGGTPPAGCSLPRRDPCCSFQFLGIPPKGEPGEITGDDLYRCMFPISRDPPEGGTKRIGVNRGTGLDVSNFSGSPRRGNRHYTRTAEVHLVFPISRDPPEGGTVNQQHGLDDGEGSFQFLGIPPKGEPVNGRCRRKS